MQVVAPESTAKIHGQELVDWLDRTDGEKRELIVEAALPPRTVTLSPRGEGRVKVSGIRGGDCAGDLERLYKDLSGLVHSPPTLLKAARAVAVRVDCDEAREILAHPLVKAVRLNRRLRVG